MSVQDDLRDMWERDEGTPLQFLAAAFTFGVMFVAIYLVAVTLWAAS